jgi:hypothetical protein
MPGFNPTEQSSLLDLLTALQGGMTGGQGYNILGGILGQQQERVDQRQAQLGSLTDLLTNAAGGGMAYEGASALADAYTRGSNVPPRIEDVLGALYPTGGPEPTNASGAVMDFPMGSRPGTPYGPPVTPQTPVQGPQAMSPIAQATASPTEQIAMEEFAQSQLLQQDYAGLAQDAANAAARGMDITEYTQKVAAANPQLIAADPKMFSDVIAQAFGGNTLQIGG